MKRTLLLFLLLPLTAETFGTVHKVQTTAPSGAGSFLQALENAAGGDTVAFELPEGQASGTVTLVYPLPANTKNLIIEGNGVTISGGPACLRTFYNADGATTVIRRIHFTTSHLVNQGNLTLQSCIFSGNRSSAGKGAIENDNGRLTVQGCTFFENTSTGHGAAIYTDGETAEASLTGCLFRHNVSAEGPSVFRAGGSIVSGGGNAFDYDIFQEPDKYFHNEDVTLAPYDLNEPDYWFSPLSFRIMPSFVFNLPHVDLSLPDYPKEDFYGEAVSEGRVFAGAVWSAVRAESGYILHCSIKGSADIRVATVSGILPDEDGILPESTIAILWDDTPGLFALSWTVNGASQPAASLSDGLDVLITTHQRVELTVYRQRLVTQVGDSGEGSLREVLSNMRDYDIVQFDDALTGGTIRIESPLPPITRHFVRIEAVGLTLAGNDYPFLTVEGTSVYLRGIHFTSQGSDSHHIDAHGGAVLNNGGEVTLHACIFSGNTFAPGKGEGGALHNAAGKMSVAACTFYNNVAFRGGAIYNTAKLELLGNIFFGNRSPVSGNGKTLFNEGVGSVIAARNLYDADGVGYAFDDKNTSIGFLPFSPVTFELTPDNPAAAEFAPPASYPEKDFYGEAFDASAPPGAVKRTHPDGRIISWETVGQGTVELVEGSPLPGSDGRVPTGSMVILRATFQGPGDNRTVRWEVNGKQLPETGDLTLTVDTNTAVCAIFNRIYTVTTTEDSPQGGQGTLRNYLVEGWQGDGDIIRFADALAGKTIVLSTHLPKITRRIVIEGNGVVLDGRNLTTPMFRVAAGAEVTLSRLRFTVCSLPDTVTAFPGGAAILNGGQLTLDNCIFDHNHAKTFSGGAIYNTNLLISNACTFCKNTAQAGGAIYAAEGTLITIGNLFSDNVASIAVDIGEAETNKNIHRYDLYLPALDPATFIPYDGAPSVPYAEMKAFFGFPSVDFYNTLRNTHTITTPGAIVLTTAVSFDTRYAEASTVPSRVVERGAFLSEPYPLPEYPGHLFVGWFEDLAGAYRWNFETRPATAESLTLYAQWQNLQDVRTVVFRFGNGTPDSLAYPSFLTNLVERPATDPSRPYYTFTGWFADEGCTLPWDFPAATVTENTTIYAGWAPFSFRVVFDLRDGSPPVEVTTVYDTPLAPPEIAPKGLSSVTGWLADTLSSALWNFTSMRVTSDTTLYAVWTPPLRAVSVPRAPSVSLTAFTVSVRLRGAGGRHLDVYAISGRLLLSMNIRTDDESIDTSAIPPGVYLFALSAPDGGEFLLLKAIKH
jgi:uncharacterized repeat protein (TIGR02543 family)